MSNTTVEVKGVDEALGIAPFHPDVREAKLADILDKTVLVIDATVVRNYRTEMGLSDFALFLVVDDDNEQAKYICGGEFVIEKIQRLASGNIFPVKATFSKRVSQTSGNEYYEVH